MLRSGRGLLLPIALLGLWQAMVSSGAVAEHLLPSPTGVLAELVALAQKGELGLHLAVTAQRVALGFALATVAATLLGALAGSSRTVRELIDPTLQAVKAVPSLAWVPLFILWFGIFEASKIVLIAVGAFFPIYLNLMAGIQGVDRKLVEVGRASHLSRLDIVRFVLVPSSLPSYLVGLRSGLALGWMFVIAAELMGASEGLGFLMLDGQMTGRPAIIVGSLLLFAAAGKLTDALLARLSRRLLHWQDSFEKQESVRAALPPRARVAPVQRESFKDGGGI